MLTTRTLMTLGIASVATVLALSPAEALADRGGPGGPGGGSRGRDDHHDRGRIQQHDRRNDRGRPDHRGPVARPDFRAGSHDRDRDRDFGGFFGLIIRIGEPKPAPVIVRGPVCAPPPPPVVRVPVCHTHRVTYTTRWVPALYSYRRDACGNQVLVVVREGYYEQVAMPCPYCGRD